MDNKIITFGCRLNAYESEAIKNAVKKSGVKNMIIFNSCAVTSQAEQQLRQAVRKARRENPDAKIVVTGCAAQINPQKYAKMKEVDLILGNQEKSMVASYENPKSEAEKNFENEGGNVVSEAEKVVQENVENPKSEAEKRFENEGGNVVSDIEENYGKNKPNYNISVNSQKSQEKSENIDNSSHKDKIFYQEKAQNILFLTDEEALKIKVNDIMSVKETAPQMVSYFDEKTRAFLEIQNGCNHRCTFCIIPFGRGNSRSVLFGDIVVQTRKMVEMGHKEIVLTGVDISDYGKDLELKITLSQMIKRLLALVPELPRLRLSSIDVAEIDDGFFELIANEPRFMPYFHLSLQSGDDLILKRMKRRHNRNQILEFCQKVRKIRPEITFGADIIAGFPTENQEMFENSLNLIEEADIIFTHIFPYSKREGTPAAKMPQIKGDVIKNRAKLLREKGKMQLQKYLEKQVGKEFEVVVEKDGFGKTNNFLDVKIVDNFQIGDLLKVKIKTVEDGFLNSEIL